MKRKSNWGRWRYDQRRRVLDLYDKKLHQYEVDLDTCTTSAAVLDWIMQIAGKTWADAELLGDLVAAFNDLLHPQSTLCGFGEEHGPIKPAEVLTHACLVDSRIADKRSATTSTGKILSLSELVALGRSPNK